MICSTNCAGDVSQTTPSVDAAIAEHPRGPVDAVAIDHTRLPLAGDRKPPPDPGRHAGTDDEEARPPEGAEAKRHPPAAQSFGSAAMAEGHDQPQIQTAAMPIAVSLTNAGPSAGSIIGNPGLR